jgi:hypothetical protein
MGVETRITKGPIRVSGTTATVSGNYILTKYTDTKDVLVVIDFTKLEVTLRLYGVEANTTNVRVTLETSMQEESDDSAEWIPVLDFQNQTAAVRTSSVTAPATPTSPTLLKYLRWKVVLSSASTGQTVGATFELVGVGRLG